MFNMNINFKFLLCGAAFCFVPQAAVAQCAVTDCQQLGYTSLKSCTGGLKCPFGEYWACPKVEEKAVLGECTGYAQNCKIADILNSDGTCSNDKVSGKTPIGVVVYISGGSDKCGYAMTASPIATNIKWSTENVSTGAFQSSNWKTAITDFDVRGNMTKIIQTANGNSSKYPAAYTALNYAPSAILTSKGKWALPTAGILNSLYTNLNAINKGEYNKKPTIKAQYPFVKRIKYSKVSLFVIVPSKSNTAIFFFPSSILITNRLGQKKSKASQG